MIFKTSLPRSDICDHSDPYIAIKETITVEGANDRGKHNRSITLKNNAAFTSSVSKVNGTLIDNAEI